MSTLINGVTTTTDYAGGFVYTNNALSFFSSPEGRIVKNGASFEYQYAIADHQGNTRVVFSSVTPAPEAKTATMEATTNTDFLNYTNRVAFNLFDHTDAGTTYTYAQKLTGGNNSQIGVAKTYKVYAGDKVKIEAWAKYQNPGSTSSNLSGFATALLAAFGVPAPGGGETGTASAALNNWGGLVAGGSGGSNPSGPKAFVNIIVFDKNYKLLDAAWEAIDPAAEQVGASPVIAHDYLMREYTAKEEGYIFMYVSNENATLVDVYFDDVVMTHTKSNVIQYNEYYPFGMNTANSWTRENTTGNNYLANGGTELNQTSQLYDLDYRNYDPILGRMNGIDPMATKYASLSPYNFSFNDPVTFNDVSGADPYQRSDDTWWVAPRGSQGRFAGYGSYENWRKSTAGAFSMSNDPWAWTGMSSGDIYGPSFSMFGASVSYGGGSSAEMKADAKAVQEGSMNIADYAAKYGENIQWYLVFSDSETAVFLDRSFHSYYGPNEGVAAYAKGEYAVMWQGKDKAQLVADYKKLMRFATKEFGENLNTSHHLKIGIDYDFKHTNAGQPGITFMPSNTISMYLSSTLFRANDNNGIRIGLKHEFVHVKDDDSGYRNSVYSKYRYRETREAIFEFRAYSVSAPYAEGLGHKQGSYHRDMLNHYKGFLPSDYKY